MRKAINILGVIFIILWMFYTAKNFDGKIESLTTKYHYLAFAGFACFYIYPLIDWLKRGMKINFEEYRVSIFDSIFPTYGRSIPLIIQLVRLLGLIVLIYFNLKSVEIVNGEIEIIFNFFPLIVLGALLFFVPPFFFPKKDKQYD